MKRKGLGTIYWAVVLILVGTFLLLNNFGYTLPIWQMLAVYWPLLLIAWGLVKIVDYYRFRDQRRRLFSVGEVVLLILIVLGGTAFTAGAYLTTELSALGVTLGEDFDLFNVLGDNHEFVARLESEVGSAPEIDIHNVYGYVEVTPTDTETMVVDVETTVRAVTREEAESLAPEMRFTLTERNGVFVLSSNRSTLDGRTRRRFTSSLRVQVPRDSSLNVENRYGAVRLTGLGGDLTIENEYGPTSVRSIEGVVQIVSGHGAVSAEGITGSLTVSNRYAPVTVSSVDGDVAVDSMQGAVRISDVGGRTTVMNRYSSVRVENVAGGVRVEGRNNSVDLERVAGGVEVETLYRDVSVRDATGPIEIVNRHGDTRLSLGVAPEDDISITGEYSDVRIELAPNASFALDAQIRSGSFESDFEGMLPLPSGRSLLVEGQHGTGGPRITILAERGSVRIVR